jgi:molecular chaperone HscB
MRDPFETLGVEPRFDIDLDKLAERHRDLSRALHPDRYAGAPAAERRLALGRAIEVNDAHRVLKDPVRRAEALLRRAGVPIGETAEPKPSQTLLMEMMDQREALADARRSKDLAAVHELASATRQREHAVLVKLAHAFSAGENHAEAALPLVGELRYVRRFLDEVSAIEEDLAP